MISDFAVIGLGAIGSSVVRALRDRGLSVSGFDADAAAVSAAVRENLEAQLWHDELRITAHTVIVCVPVRAATAVLQTLARRRDYHLITDVGSTKRAITAAAEAAHLGHCFVGAHPLAGTEQSGWAAGSGRMFEGKTVFLCPTAHSGSAALQAARELWQSLGASCQEMSAEEHDERIAWLSHLPQLTATALALALHTGQVQRCELGRGGIDMTRLAASDPRLWLDILETNADNLNEPLGCLIEALTELRSGLQSGHSERIAALLNSARAWSA